MQAVARDHGRYSFKNNTVMLDGDDFGECVMLPFSTLAVKIKVVIL